MDPLEPSSTQGDESPETHGQDDWLEAALQAANLPTLACMLVQMTGERRWIEGDYRPTRARGMDDNDDGGLAAERRDDIRAAAARAIRAWKAGRPLALPAPSDELLREMMGVSLGEDIPADYAAMIRHELQPPALDAPSSALPQVVAKPSEGFRVLIIGAGISGLCAAVQLGAAGVDYAVVERSEVLGGVWFENRYPGAACDVPSHLYSFSFAPYAWSRYFAGSGEIHAYLEHVAERFDIKRHIRFGLEVETARFDGATRTWALEATGKDGRRETLRANAVISGVGAFNKPRLPDVEGLDRFEGPSVHTARYPEQGLELAGKRVVLVGNGASAMQVAPAIVDEVARLTIIQRTPQWAAPFPKFQRAVPEAVTRLMEEVPLYRLWYRIRLSWAFNDKLYDALQRDPAWSDEGRSINAINAAHRKGLTAYIEAELGGAAPALLDKVLPDYPPFGKRMLMDNGWFRTLAKPKVELVQSAVTEVRPHGVVTRDGEEHPADVLIWATGFDVVNLLAPMRVIGREGRELHADWDGDDARAYLGTTVPGYPNFFCLYGPNTQFGHGGSLISVLERQMHYVLSLLQQMFAAGLDSVEVRQEAHDAYNIEVDAAHDRLIWTTPGLGGYYKNSKGRIVVNNPFRIIEVWKMTETANLQDYICTPAPAASRPALQAAEA